MSIYVKQSFGLQELSDGGQWEYREAKLGTDIASGEIIIYANPVSKLLSVTGWFQPNIVGISANIIIASELLKTEYPIYLTAVPYSGIKNSITLVYDNSSRLLYTNGSVSQNVLKEKYYIQSAMGVYYPT